MVQFFSLKIKHVKFDEFGATFLIIFLDYGFMTKSISCADLGHQGCEFHAHADSDEELLKQVKAHAAESHEITEFTPEVIEQVKSKIKEE